ncbi:MAG TPA: hypothetical protein PLJ34_05425, partial [Hyphomicrobiales bacterium]|nr:hypothetical protein [Hyphomicrobiales bacterium]
MEAEALGGSGGSTIGSGTISARGGDSGNAIATQDRIWGDIDIEALGIVTVIANDSNPLPASSPTIVSGIGHRMDVKAIAGLIAGANGSIDQTAESLYFTYEALYEFKQRVA